MTKEEIEKLSEKSSFLTQKSLYEDIKEMTDVEAKVFLMAQYEYVIYGIVPDFDKPEQRAVKVALNRFKRDYDSDSKKWLKSCKKKSESKAKEWENRRNKNISVDVDKNTIEHPDYPESRG